MKTQSRVVARFQCWALPRLMQKLSLLYRFVRLVGGVRRLVAVFRLYVSVNAPASLIWGQKFAPLPLWSMRNRSKNRITITQKGR